MQYINSLFLQKPTNLTVEVDKENHVYRSKQAVDGLVTTPLFPHLEKDDCTVTKVWDNVTRTNADKQAFGYRKLVKIHTKTKPAVNADDQPKQWSMYELEDYQWWTFGEAKTMSDKIAGAMQKHGLTKGDRVLLYAKTRAEWMLTAMACFRIGAVVTTAYDTMPPDAVTHIIGETEPKAIMTETSLMGTLNKAYKKLEKEKQPSLILYTGHDFEAPGERDKFMQAQSNEIDLCHLHSVFESSAADLKDSTVRPDDLALIMYTSGTSGTPKGVELTHGNIVAAMGSAERLVSDFIDPSEHCYIGFLPLAHVLEFVLEFIFITMGIPIGYGTTRTLMDDAVCGPGGQGHGTGDLQALKPTIMAGVPAVWERIRKGVMGKLAKHNVVIQRLFGAALEAKWQLVNYFGKENAITRALDATVFTPVHQATGGRLRYSLSGGAPLSVETQKFVASALCFILQGYGLTECCGLGAITLPSLGYVTGVIGPPSPSIEFRLVDVPETDYKAKDGVGELWIRGPSMMRGYYKRPDLTKEALTDDGWFKSGDVARVLKDGTFAITDRAKNLVKLAHGEYIALESLESTYRNNPKIKNIGIIANSDKSYIVALVEPVDQAVNKASLLKDLQETAKKGDCARVEIVKDILVTRDDDWSQNYLTTSGKLKRKDLQEAYKSDIERMYK